MRKWMKSGLTWALAVALVFFGLPTPGIAALQTQVPLTENGPELQEEAPILATDQDVEQFLLSSISVGSQGMGAMAVANPNKLRLIRKHVSPGGETNYIYQQLYRDVPVYGKYAKVRLDETKRPEYVDNELTPDLALRNIGTVPSVSESQAIDALVRDVEQSAGISIRRNGVLYGVPVFHGEASKVLVPGESKHRLAWQVTISYFDPEPGSWVGLVDAHTGEVFDKYSQIHALKRDNGTKGSGNGHYFYYEDVQIYHDQDGEIDPDNVGHYFLVDVSRNMFIEDDEYWSGVIQTFIYEKDPQDPDNFFYGWVWSDDTEFAGSPYIEDKIMADALDAHVLVGEVYDFFLGQYGRDSFDGWGTTVTSLVYHPHFENNAAWLGGVNTIAFGIGTGTGVPEEVEGWNYPECMSCAGEVVAHEFAHGVVQYTAGLEYRNQSGALNESFADIFGAVFSRDGNPWLFGEETGAPMRSFSSPEDYDQPDHMQKYRTMDEDMDNGGVHTNSGIPNHAAYLIATGIEESGLLNGILDGVYGPDGIGREALGQIAYRALYYMTPVDTFADARYAYLFAAEEYADDLGLAEEDKAVLIDIVDGAWAAVGVTAPEAELAVVDVFHPDMGWTIPTIVPETRTAYFPVPASFAIEDLELTIVTSDGTWAEPAVPVFNEWGWASIRVTDGTDSRTWVLMAVYLPEVIYSGVTFHEAGANDGTIGNTITATLLLDTFTGQNGDDFVQNGIVEFGNVPAGLTPRAIRVSDQEVRLELTGRADSHAANNSIDNLWMYFTEDAFASVGPNDEDLKLGNIYGHQTYLSVDFDSPPAPSIPIIAFPPVGNQAEPEATDEGTVINVSQSGPVKDSNGSVKWTVDLAAEELEKAFRLLAENKDKPQTIAIPLVEEADAYDVSFPASALVQGLQSAEDARLSIRAGSVTYDVPLASFDAAKLAEELQASNAGNVKITVSINRVTGETGVALTRSASASGLELVGDAYEYEIVASSGDKKTEINWFSKPVTRTLTIQGNHAGQTAVVRFDPERGRFIFVPASFKYENGKTTVTFTRSSNSIYAVVKYTPVFADLTNHWARNDIEQLALRQIVSGTSANAYQPNGRVTRAQFASMLVKALELKADATELPFKDVHPSAWYANPVAAGVESGLFSGFEDGTFRPNDPISREQMAVMLTKALADAGVTGPVADAGAAARELARFSDRDAISGWAADSVAKATAAGLLFGRSNGSFAPKDDATRAEAAAIITRLLHLIEQ